MVNTFLPFSNFKEIAKCLDNKRLGKQRVEAQQILNTIEKKRKGLKTTGWVHHPIVHMWYGYEQALKYYINVMIQEWVKRGFVNNMHIHKITKIPAMPWFVKCQPINWSHQASLIRKHPSHYTKLFNPPAEYLKHKYIWLHRSFNNTGIKSIGLEKIKVLKTGKIILKEYADVADEGKDFKTKK
jgi:hypothetical protein